LYYSACISDNPEKNLMFRKDGSLEVNLPAATLIITYDQK